MRRCRAMALFQHYCKSCVTLGPYFDAEYGDMDLYWCPESVTVLARFGNDEPEYISGLNLMFHVPSLLRAFTRAFDWGLLTITSSNIGNEFGTFNIPSTYLVEEEETAVIRIDDRTVELTDVEQQAKRVFGVAEHHVLWQEAESITRDLFPSLSDEFFDYLTTDL